MEKPSSYPKVQKLLVETRFGVFTFLMLRICNFAPSQSRQFRLGRQIKGTARTDRVPKNRKQTFWPFVGSDFLSRPDEKKLEKMGEVTTKPTNNLILVTNIAPQATRDQMNTLFSFVGRVDELKLYPSVRDASINIECRCCFVRFSDPSSVPITQHLNNTVFIDRAVIVTPVIDNVIPDETMGIILSQRVQTQQQQTGGGGVVGVKGDSGEIEGPATAELAGIADAGEFQDPRLEAAGLPPYPALAPDTAAFLVNEVRRTVVVINVDSTISAQQCMEFFATEAGEVKFFRYCTRNNDPLKYALIEFSERTSVVPAMLMSGRQLGNSVITGMISLVYLGKTCQKVPLKAIKLGSTYRVQKSSLFHMLFHYLLFHQFTYW